MEPMEEDREILAEARALEPRNESEFLFQGRPIRTAQFSSGQGYVVLRYLCEAFGLSYTGQRQRLYRSGIFREYSDLIYIQTTSGRQPMLCLAAFAVPAFLLGVETSRITNEETRVLLEAFQEEGMIALAEHFGISERAEIRFLRDSITRMTTAQAAFEAHLVKNVEAEVAAERAAREEKVEQIRGAFAKMRDQIHHLEKIAGPKIRISPEQVGQIRQTVMVLGELMIRAGYSARPWPAIYTDITLQFGFSRTEDITDEALPAVLAFLDRQVEAFRARVNDGSNRGAVD